MAELLNPLYHNLYKFIESQSALLITNSDGVIQYGNMLYYRLSGFSKEDIIGKSFKDFHTEFHPLSFYEELWSAFQQGKPWSGSVLSKGKEKNFWSKLFVLPIKSDQVAQFQVLLIHFDIQDLKSDLYLEQENFSKIELGALTNSLGHEINNPLAIILGKVSGLKRKLETVGVDAKVIEDLDKIATATDRIGKIIKAIKSYGRGEMNQPMASVEFGAIVENVMQLEKKRMMDHKIEVRQSIEYTGPLVCRSNEIEQVFVYLMNSAYEALGEADGLWLEVNSRLIGNEFVLITLKDSGTGSRPHGLGVSFGQKLIENHGGVLYQDLKNPNTMFVIALPLNPLEQKLKLTQEIVETRLR